MALKSRKHEEQIKIFEVKEPLDPFYPFERDLYENERVLYHGTWSAYVPLIEKYGMGKGNLAYVQKDIDNLYHLGWVRFGFRGRGHNVLDACAYGVPPNKRKIYLTLDYWLALTYAGKDRGGETVHHATMEIADLERFFSDGTERKAHEECLRNEATKLESDAQQIVMEQIARLKNKTLLDQSRQQLLDISNRIKPLSAEGYPVVYAIKGYPRWFKDSVEPNSPCYRIQQFQVMRVTASRLKARADFRNGIQQLVMDAPMPEPVNWNPLPYLKYLREYPVPRPVHILKHIEWLQKTSNAAIRQRWIEVLGTV